MLVTGRFGAYTAHVVSTAQCVSTETPPTQPPMLPTHLLVRLLHFEVLKQVVGRRDGVDRGHDHANAGLQDLVLAQIGDAQADAPVPARVAVAHARLAEAHAAGALERR